MKILLFIAIASLSTSFLTDGFKSEQLKFPRVRQAYADKEESFKKILKDHSIQQQNLRIYLRAFKYEKEIELWAKNSSDNKFQFLKKYDICQTSGRLGPKRQQGDFQIPEGFYYIDAFNPWSNYYLSMKINYPNKSDQILGEKGNLGGNICIHGSCVTIGCMPLTDEYIKELYLFCVEAKNNGQSHIPVTVYPAILTDANFSKLKEQYSGATDKINLWTDLKIAYDKYKITHQLPKIIFKENGRHEIR